MQLQEEEVGAKVPGSRNDEDNKASLDLTLCLSDEIFLRILKWLPQNAYPCSLVCKRWFRLHGLFRYSIMLKEWNFLESGQMTSRFPNLNDVDLTIACVPPPKNSVVWLTNQFLKIQLTPQVYDSLSIERFILEQQLLPSSLDKGLKILAEGCQGLQRLCVVDARRPVYDQVRAFHRHDMNGVTGKLDKGASRIGLKHFAEENEVSCINEAGIAWIAKNCQMLQELELHHCTDESFSAISACKNLQILRVVGSMVEFYHLSFTDIGLTILGHNCKHLVQLELSGCECSYDGIAAIGQCCLMLEELTLMDQNFYEGWIAALSYCHNLKALRLESCRGIDPNPGRVEHLGFCPALQRLQLGRCKLRDDKVGFGALVLVCAAVRELEFQDCWGLEDEVFKLAINCRRVRCLSLEGCSLLSILVLETVLHSLKDLQRLPVLSCNNIKDTGISSSLASLFTFLKELKWQPDKISSCF